LPRRADGDVEPAVRAEPNELPSRGAFRGIAVGDTAVWPRVELRLDIVERRMRFTSATYSAPSLSATPFGILSPRRG